MSGVSSERLRQRIQRYLEQNQRIAARIALETLVQREPSDFDAHLQLGAIAYTDNRLREASRHTLDALRVMPDDPACACRIVPPLLQVGEVVAAKDCLLQPSIARCESGAVLARLASSWQMIGDHAATLAMLERARTLGHDGPDFRFIYAVQLMFNGRLDEAERELNAFLANGHIYGRACVTMARLRKQTVQGNHLSAIRERLARVAPGSEDHGALEYALYKELEDIGDYEQAFKALQRGAAVMFAGSGYDGERESAICDRLMELCTPDFFGHTAPKQSGPQPIFIVGMPRSGTTLLDRILGSHSQVVSVGELGDFARALRWCADHVTVQPLDETILARIPTLDFAEVGTRYLAQTQWRAEGKRFYVDKMPINWIQVAFIRRALPQARILHMTREPMDVCFSNYRAYFGTGYAYSYNMDALAAYYLRYRRVIDHWKRVMPAQILDVSYEALIEDSETVARQALQFCGLAYEASCIDLQRNESAVATLSAAQVREPIHQRALGEWRRYERQLTPLASLLANAGS
ncbi:MAG: tetratricopeptide repeat-containing sulfotransferase family protein [Rudaea sp.]